MVDLFLLSFGVASTGGFLDLHLSGLGIRVSALLEMLLVVGVAGTSLVVAARTLVDRLANRFERPNDG